MTTNEKSPSIVARTAGCLWRLIKFVIAITLGILLGVALYWGGFYAYTGILAPINTNYVAVKTVEGDLRRANDVWEAELKVRDEKIRLLSEQLGQQRAATDAVEQRLNARLGGQEEALRHQVASQQEALQKQIASLDEQRQALIGAIGNQERRGDALDRALQDQQATLQDQQEILQAQQETLQAQQEHIAQIAAAEGALEAAIADTAKELNGGIAAVRKDFEAEMAGLEADFGTLEDQISGPEPELVQLREQTLLLKAAAQVLRVRIRLVQNNPGGAREDLTQLDATLAGISELPEADAETIAGLRDQVAQLQIALDENPFIVSEQLDVLWLAITDLIAF